MRAQQRQQGLQSLTAVTDAIFLLRVTLRQGAAIREHEQGVVAETALPLRRVPDLPDQFAANDERLGIGRMAQRHHDADKARQAQGLALHLLQQQTVVGGVLFGTGPLDLRREAGRAHARQSTERFHTKTRIVGQCGKAGVKAGVTRLGQRIFDKGGMRLFGLGQMKFALGLHLAPQRRQQGRELGELARIARRKHDPPSCGSRRRHRQISSACLCSATSSAMPRCARSIMPSSCCRENGAPSAVPCTSISAPSAVPTTFISVSHWLSSA